MSDSERPQRRQPTRLPRPWDSSGQNTGVDCHFLLQCMKVKSESEVAQSCPTPSDPMDCSPPGSSIHGIGSWSLICSLRPFVNEGNSSHFGPDTLQIFQPKENGMSLGIGSHESLAEPCRSEYGLSNFPHILKDGNLN